MRRILFRYISLASVLRSLRYISGQLATNNPQRKGRGRLGTSLVDYASPPLTMEFLTAMDLPAIVAVGPALISGQYLIEIYPAYGAFSERLWLCNPGG